MSELLNGIEAPAERRLHAHPAYQDILEQLRAMRQEHWIDSSLEHIQRLYSDLSKKLEHLELQQARLDPTEVSFNKQSQIDELIPQVRVLKELLNLKQAIR